MLNKRSLAGTQSRIPEWYPTPDRIRRDEGPSIGRHLVIDPIYTLFRGTGIMIQVFLISF